MLLYQKYAPKSLSEFAGNEEVVEFVHKWALKFEKGEVQQPLLLYGPPGIGKTALAYALASEMGWEILELNASDTRNKKEVERIMGAASSNSGLFSRFKLILIDEVDGLQGNVDRGGASAIVKIVKEARQPVILIANDGWSRKISGLRPYCKFIEMKKIHKRTIRDVLRKIAVREGLNLSDELLDTISKNSNGDLRSAILDLQSYTTGSYRDREKVIFDSMRLLFKSMDVRSALSSFDNSALDHDTFKLWVEQNIKNEYESSADVACAYDSLSRADLYDGRIINRQAWKLLKYSNFFMLAGVALCKDSVYRKFTKYEFPTYLRSMSASSKQRSFRKSILSKIAIKCHCSIEDAKRYVPLLKIAVKKSPGVGDYFEFSDDELAFLPKLKVF